MLGVLLGAALVVAGLLYMAYQAISRGRMSDPSPSATPTGATLEPSGPKVGRGAFDLRANWPGLALVVLGGILLVTGGGNL